MAFSSTPLSAADAATVQTLRAKDQALLDAVAVGGRALWDAALTPDAVYVDENGTTIPRAEFLKELEPLPAGNSGTLKIVQYDAAIHGNVALVIHHDDERESYHGIPLHAQYISSETWLNDGSAWHLAFVHTYVVAADPPAIAISPAQAASYAGRYRAAKDLTYVIRANGASLTGGVDGGKPHPISVETADVLFTPGRPRIKFIFRRDATGYVTSFVDRREGEDIVWRRIGDPPDNSR